MTDSIKDILKKLDIEDTGKYENHFYIIRLADSNEYAKMYTKLTKNAINTGFPNFEANEHKTIVKITNYFEIDANNITYNIFLFADFKDVDNDKYYLKIGEK